jgi:carboxyl-terminal processing protease
MNHADPLKSTGRSLRRWAVVPGLALACAALGLAPLLTRAAAPKVAPERQAVAAARGANDAGAGALGSTEVASIDQLKTQAYDAAKAGQFDRSNELLSRAAAISHDPSIERMVEWTGRFESQRKEFATERRKQYDKQVAHVRTLLIAKKDDFAIDAAANAFNLADDKKAFRQEKWVDELITKTAKKADQYDRGEQWLRSLRLYSDLAAVEPANPLWKEKLKAVTRRVRLLALYTPDSLKALQESDSKEREEVRALIKDDDDKDKDKDKSKDAAKEKDKKDAEKVDNDAFRIDWRETLRGVKMDMLWDALVDARDNYFREVNYKKLGVGGLEGVRSLLTTKGLEKSFPLLADSGRRALFLKTVDDQSAAMKAAGESAEAYVLRGVLGKLRQENKTTVQLPEEVLWSEFADGAFAELDPFTGMIWPADLEEFNKTTQGEFSGVGIQIQTDDDGSLKVVSPLEDSPAYKAGIKAGDVVDKINGKNAKGITLNQAVKTITGPRGTKVTLTVRSPNDKVKEYTIVRETIKVASVKGWQHRPGGGWEYFVDPENKIGYLRMTNFTKDTAKELDRSLDELAGHGAKAVILDLRYNPGGLLTAATDVSDKFLSKGAIVSTRPERDNGNQNTEARAKSDEGDSELPLVVLVNQYSASASEIVSGALKDQNRALIVGERTFGKGSVQMLFPLSDRSAYLKLTTSHYYLPSGRCIHREENSQDWGVNPDVTVEMTPEQMRAAIDARQELDILRDANSPPAEGELEKVKDKAPVVQQEVKQVAAGGNKKDLLSTDPQLSAAVLLLKLQLAGAQL